MATSADIGAGNSRYTGDVGLGGGTFGAVKLDLRPIEDLAKYTFLYNKSEYDQRQKDAEAAANEIADVTSYDLTTGIPKDAKVLQEKYDKLTSYVRDNPNALDYRNKKEWAEYKRMRNDLENDLKGAKVRSIMFMSRQEEIQKAKSPQEKERLQKNLDSEIVGTDIRTPLKYTDVYDVKPIEVSAAPIKKVNVTEIGKNIIGQDIWEMPDMDAVSNQAIAISSGLIRLEDFKKTDSFISKTPKEQQLFIDQYEAQSSSGKLEPIESVKNFNSALKSLPDSYYKDDGSGNKILDLDKLAESDNSIINGIAQQIGIYNTKMQQMKSGIDNGFFKDNFNNKLSFSNDASGLKKNSYKEVNINDGLSVEELIKMRILATSAATSREVKIIETDDAIQEAQIATQRRGQDIGLLSDREGRAMQKYLAELKPTVGKTVAEQMAEYPILKTDELIDAIGDSPKKASELTEEQKNRIEAQMSIGNLENAIVSVNGSVITVKTEKSGTVKIQADDITKSYFDDVNKIDAGKENVQRRYYELPSRRGSIKSGGSGGGLNIPGAVKLSK